MNHERYFNVARLISKKSTHHTYRLGCVIVNKNQIVGIGFNQNKTHPKSPHKWHSVHAEFHALLGVDPYLLKNAIVFVYRENVNGKVGMAKPCPTCQKMLESCEVKRIVYTTENSYETLELKC